MSEDDRQRAWAAAGRAAAAQVEDGMRVGLGTGRAAAAGIRALAERVRGGLRVWTTATSRASADLARAEGLRVGRLGARGLDLAFDGADCVRPDGLAVKGGGGAHVRERVVAESAERFLVLVDGAKLVASLDEWGHLPLAVVPFAAARVRSELEDVAPVTRGRRSDDGLVLMDLYPVPGGDWRALAERARALPGVVDHGLFALDPIAVLVGSPDGSVATAAEETR
jgi:ribose 5-phosphate isomerase A